MRNDKQKLIVTTFTTPSPLHIAEGVNQIIEAFCATDLKYITTFPVQHAGTFSIDGKPKIEIMVLVALIGSEPDENTKLAAG